MDARARPGLTPGDYVARLHAVDRRGRTLRRTATASGRSRLTAVAPPPPAASPVAPPATPVGSGVFPVRGPYSLGDGFGAERGRTRHRGQNILAPEGTPVVAPRGGVVSWRAYQADGAGPLRGHRRRRRPRLRLHAPQGRLDRRAEGRSGEPPGRCSPRSARTGRTSGLHLHFEIWPTGWYSSDDAQPVDPRPDLDAWAAG